MDKMAWVAAMLPDVRGAGAVRQRREAEERRESK